MMHMFTHEHKYMCGDLKDSFQGNYFKNFIYLFLERGRERQREGRKHQCVVASHTPTTGDLARNPGMCPDWE